MAKALCKFLTTTWNITEFLGQSMYITTYDKHFTGRAEFARKWKSPVATETNEEGKKMYTIVTGANGGLGFAIANDIMASGENVILACRSAERGLAAEKKLQSGAGPYYGKAKYLNCDVSDFESVNKFVVEAKEYITSMGGTLKCLVNNAAIMAAPYAVTKQGYESQFAVNHLGHALLTDLIVKWFKEVPHPGLKERRIVSVASAGSYFGSFREQDFVPETEKANGKDNYNEYKCYTSSKLSMVMFSKGVAKELDVWNAQNGENQIVINSIHPGCIATSLGRSLPFMNERTLEYSGSMIIQPPESAAFVTKLMYDQELAGKNGTFYYMTTDKIAPPKNYKDDNLTEKILSRTRAIILPFEQ
eukprot:TRINITY_DN3091_c6_g1_i1.p1 TRINITY_DN3091_c6_g1~~TRINITY_DN3091_c6_g1_i1.p1  ORF type:complete len:383 (+),score=80.06 TRINITY_DN3091_c6_g1_i1:69-1151(+)